MDPTQLKAALHDLLDRTYADQQALLGALSAADRAAAGTPERWSLKDTIAHITFWKRTMADRLVAAAQDQTPRDVDDFEPINAQTFEANRARSWADIIADADQAHADLIAQVQALPAADLVDTQRLAWQKGRALGASILSNGAWHPQTHIAQCYVERGEAERATSLMEALAQASSQLGEPIVSRGEVVYNLACFYATSDQPDKALALLPEALRLRPDLVEWSKQDSDLIALHGLPAYQALYT